MTMGRSHSTSDLVVNHIIPFYYCMLIMMMPCFRVCCFDNNNSIKISNLSFRVSGIVLLRGDTEQEPHGSGDIEEEDRSVTVPGGEASSTAWSKTST